jgi:hypothetical protein
MLNRLPEPLRGTATGWLVYVIPICYLLFAVLVQPANKLGAGGWRQMVFDDLDWAAIILRVANSEQHRRPGWPVDPCTETSVWGSLTPHAADPKLNDQYYLEYPNAVVGLFRGLWSTTAAGASSKLPSVFLDQCQQQLVLHEPATPSEVSIWRSLRRSVQIFQVFTISCLLLMIWLLRRGMTKAM